MCVAVRGPGFPFKHAGHIGKDRAAAPTILGVAAPITGGLIQEGEEFTRNKKHNPPNQQLGV